jgi:long-subunit acyl-CoA synthetase (AMP-forming)
VGGAPVGAALLQAAHAKGLPAMEGYGLSEAASVQTLNLPGDCRPGSVGRPLPHAQVRVAADGELWVAGSLFKGYLGGVADGADGAPSSPWWPTGDLGRIDADGHVHVEGRKSHLIITAFGRNVSPEWVETQLRSHPAVAQAVVFGEGEVVLSAVLWPTVAGADLAAAVESATADLPDYARIGHWTPARAAFEPATGMATANGRPQRAAIHALHAADLPTNRRP